MRCSHCRRRRYKRKLHRKEKSYYRFLVKQGLKFLKRYDKKHGKVAKQGRIQSKTPADDKKKPENGEQNKDKQKKTGGGLSRFFRFKSLKPFAEDEAPKF